MWEIRISRKLRNTTLSELSTVIDVTNHMSFAQFPRLHWKSMTNHEDYGKSVIYFVLRDYEIHYSFYSRS
jgi:hypothetical protein